ncbi:DnaA N-terminal domain-containing protein [Palleronia caenipelagi]|uniref:DnaA N-terminal domain-containing protein n=1 Tax=Palleronia caenipelagi TaxID=2489174 RepID=A0A547PUB8_9RHOB|nr:DnaA N-terminal domain-containing protein [Palleronia caenipelagi]TRD17736.1 hypothetical protein FEV53_12730 [Palleronia caenipelagi]
MQAVHPIHTTKKVVGPGASSLKYDILTALLVTGNCSDTAEARLAPRLALILTARFNWRRGTFRVGQRELARMWGVTERTVKRELSVMRSMGWIAIAAPPARGRVAEYSLDLRNILQSTRPFWTEIGPDFAARMDPDACDPQAMETNVVPIRRDPAALPSEDGTIWPSAARALRDHSAQLFEAWFVKLVPVGQDGGVFSFTAPSRFVADYVQTHLSLRLLAALSAADSSIREIRVFPAQ